MKFETYEAAPGQYRWRLRNEAGEIISLRPGKIMGLGSAADMKAAELAVNMSLARLSAGATPRRRRRQGTAKAAKR